MQARAMDRSGSRLGWAGLCGAVLPLLAASGLARAVALDWLPSGVKTIQKGDGWAFADGRGMTLYTFDRDEGSPGKSSCKAACAEAWPAVLAPADATAHGPWTVVHRDDGSLQWAYRGRPLYRYAADPFAGATYGDGVGTVWHVAFQPIATPGGIGIGSAWVGRVLTDERGLTLYTRDADRPGKTDCDAECLKSWRPVAAPWAANPFGEFSISVREDGFRQWAYKGKALYRQAADATPGELHGDGIRGWHAVLLEPAPPLPAWATVAASDAGELVADPKGHTVYTHDDVKRNGLYGTNIPAECKGIPDCVESQFVPFLAAPDAKPTGSWSIVKRADGRMQWAYKGLKVFTNVNDQQPGDFKGIRFGGDRAWAAVMRNGEPMQGVTVGG
jgi:predicted lipoprotein with Yx(FWY)xxD motif